MLRKIGKKGDVTDIFTFLIIVFFISISMLIAAFANDQIKQAIQNTQLNDTDVAQSAIEQLDNITTYGVQNGTLMIVAFTIIGMMISSFMVRIHPIFLFMYIIFLSISMFIGVPLANTYQLLSETAVMSTVAAQQPMITWIMEHLLWIILGTGALSMIITFGKLKEGGADTP